MPKLEDLLNDHIDMFENHRPNDEEFLNVFPELAEEIDYIYSMIQNNNNDNQIETLITLNAFNDVWFPDSIDQDLQNKYRNLIKQTYTFLGVY